MIKLKREFNSARTYLGDVQDNSPGTINDDGGVDDTSSPSFLDQDPQSNNSKGKVYDLDAPGLAFREDLPVGSIRRQRFNFKEWAEFDDNGTKIRCSEFIKWFARQSIKKTALPNTWQRDNGIKNDNEVGDGQTKITPDLK